MDLSYQNTRLSPKGLFQPHSERMFEYSLAKDDPEAGILQGGAQRLLPAGDLRASGPVMPMPLKLVDVNFDTPQYRGPVVGEAAGNHHPGGTGLQSTVRHLFLHLGGDRAL